MRTQKRSPGGRERRFPGSTLLLIATLGVILPVGLGAQTQEIEGERPVFEFLSKLVDHRCEIRETWPDGAPFRLDKEFTRGLDGRIVTVSSFTVDDEGGRSPRNLGIRAYPLDGEDARFWEFDRSGGVTEGPAWVEGGTLIYEYTYNGDVLRDTWTAGGDGAYSFKVRAWADGAWGPTYMDGTFHCTQIDPAGG